MNGWNRRDVIIATGAGAVACAVATPALGGAATTLARRRSDIVVCDDRFAASRRFAEAAAKSGARIVRTQGDVTDFWRDELDLLWRREMASLSGLTAYPAFFYLERLAMDRGMRVTFKAEQRADGHPRLIQWAIGPKAKRGAGGIA